jgi:hypothetical protein
MMQLNSTKPFAILVSWKGVAVIALLLIAATSLEAQIKVFPILRKAPAAKQVLTSGRIQAASLTLPFFDDFSFTPVDDPSDTTSNYPLSSLWQNSNSTWITSSTGINMPSINAAVMDGVDSVGNPYSDQVLANGFRDELLSQPIDLSLAKVASGERGTVWLSFYYQCGGNGEQPDENDFLRVEFLDKDSTWLEMASIYPTAATSASVFYDTMIQVNEERFFHEAFQFRFRSFGRQSGPYDTWILDHIWLDKGRTLSINRYPNDIALASTISPLFGRYYAMPLASSKLKDNLFSNVQFDVQSLQDSIENRSYSLRATVRTYVDSILTKTYNEDLENDVDLGVFDEFVRKRRETTSTIDPVEIDTTADWIDIDYKLWLIANVSAGEPPLFRINDTTTAHYNLRNYYAYDDGSAEYSLILTQPGNRLLYAFDIDTVERRFAGFDIYIPPFGVTESTRVDFIIHGHDEATNGPGEVLYTMSSMPIARSGMNEFQRFTIPETDQDVLVKKKIYIGWVAPVGITFHVGLDRSNDTADKVFAKTSGDWQTVDSFFGSIMMRPLFGRGIRIPSGVEEELVNVPLYPNPSRGEFFIDSRTEITSVVNIAGQSIAYESEFANDEKRITLAPTAPGLYLVKMKKGNRLFVRKLSIRE